MIQIWENLINTLESNVKMLVTEGRQNNKINTKAMEREKKPTEEQEKNSLVITFILVC